ncbi:YbaB/EbfC family nucleoid-associated protein [Micromonospora sp. NPDC049366]|uniref:YbaB/EbfC family nucleoid-associated protein n=1 Tax=Micromonospora sp. NPDC049366 TaxID=3364271 RepID=UPI00379BD427
MSISREPDELEQTLTATRRMLESLRASVAASPAGAGDDPPQGDALDGAVLVTATSGGRIERIEIAPHAKRLPLEEVAEGITAAVNDALAEAAARRSGTTPEAAATDLAALSEQVQRIQDDGLRQMARFTTTLNDVMTRLGRQQ